MNDPARLFEGRPKQWLVVRETPPGAEGIEPAFFGDWRVFRAPGVPVIRLKASDGNEAGLIVGWAVRQGRLLVDGETVALDPGETAEAALHETCGRCVLLYWREGAVRLRLDAGGLLPAVFAPGLGAVASTVTVLDATGHLPADAEVQEVFDFPNRRGFLPFGLTGRIGAERLLPHHELHLERMEAQRIWPQGKIPRIDPSDEAALQDAVEEIARRVREAALAIIDSHETATLFLSGGHDSRMVLAACRDRRDRLACQTIGPAGSQEVFVARQVARYAGVRHERLDVEPMTRSEVEAWLERTGRCIHDPVTYLAATAAKHDHGHQPMTGTSAEILRASNWLAEDLGGSGLDLETLMQRIRMPATPRFSQAGEAWLEGALAAAGESPGRPEILDIAKVEQIHGCWAAPSVYGHPIPRPSMHPFNIGRVFELSFALPDEWKASGETYRRHMQALWPGLMEAPVNRAAGLDRLRFPKDELKRMLPKRVKQILKPFR